MKIVDLDKLLPADIPEGERVLWFGRPEWVSLLRQAYRADLVAAYFGALAIWNAVVDSEAGAMAAGVASIARWNALCASGRDEDFGRPPGSMRPIVQPPFIGAPVHATLSNTQGGPVHDAQSRILDVWGAPIPRLYAAGEMGSAFGHLYFSGANIAECFVTGRVAGTGVAREPAGA